ncbi:hypothetical protein C8J55DRAFT_567846 [Lentinula edodes]|nr:hypothetical protein C8J55DRAFT_567846 [Lentinula edodes]
MRMQDWEQQDQDLKECEIALKERELSLYQREVLLWESKADLARRKRQDADALYERWKRARDYHITAIESEKRMWAEIKDERKRLEEYEKEVVRMLTLSDPQGYIPVHEHIAPLHFTLPRILLVARLHTNTSQCLPPLRYIIDSLI